VARFCGRLKNPVLCGGTEPGGAGAPRSATARRSRITRDQNRYLGPTSSSDMDAPQVFMVGAVDRRRHANLATCWTRRSASASVQRLGLCAIAPALAGSKKCEVNVNEIFLAASAAKQGSSFLL